MSATEGAELTPDLFVIQTSTLCSHIPPLFSTNYTSVSTKHFPQTLFSSEQRTGPNEYISRDLTQHLSLCLE